MGDGGTKDAGRYVADKHAPTRMSSEAWCTRIDSGQVVLHGVFREEPEHNDTMDVEGDTLCY